MTDWATKRTRAASLRLRVQVLAAELDEFFDGTPTGLRTQRRLERVTEALTWVIGRADRELRRLRLVDDDESGGHD